MALNTVQEQNMQSHKLQLQNKQQNADLYL